MARVLIVDDNETNLYLLRTVLQGHGFVVDEASDGAAALEKAGRAAPDLVISDLLMPVMDGYTLLREWKADPRFREVPFVVFTATYSEPQDRKLALNLGADAYILKSTEPEPLVAQLREVLAGASPKMTEAPASIPAAESQMREYNRILVRKLEEKMQEVERSNRELEQANAKLRQLSQRLLEIQEAERAAIARELHDEIGQSLTAIKLAVQRISRRMKGQDAVRLTDCVALTSVALGQVRSRALELRPPQLDQLGLTAALRDLTERMAASSGLDVHFDTNGEDVHPGYAQATAAFRVVQEALTNVVRHAGAGRAWVELRRRNDELVIAVKDDGRAFDVARARQQGVKGKSMGIIGMEERVKLAGGWLRIESQSGVGTRVEAGFPVDAPSDVPA